MISSIEEALLIPDTANIKIKGEDYEDFFVFDFDENKNIFQLIYENKFILRRFLVSFWLWLVNQVMYYQTLLNLEKFKESIPNAPFVFFFSYICSNLVVAIIANKWPRKTMINFGSVITFLSILFILLVEDNLTVFASNYIFFYKTVSFFIFTFFFSFTGNFIYIYIPELFPAQIKNICMSYSKIPAKIFLGIAPLILYELKSLYILYLIMNGAIPLLLIYTPETQMYEEKIE